MYRDLEIMRRAGEFKEIKEEKMSASGQLLALVIVLSTILGVIILVKLGLRRVLMFMGIALAGYSIWLLLNGEFSIGCLALGIVGIALFLIFMPRKKKTTPTPSAPTTPPTPAATSVAPTVDVAGIVAAAVAAAVAAVNTTNAPAPPAPPAPPPVPPTPPPTTP